MRTRMNTTFENGVSKEIFSILNSNCSTGENRK